MLAVPVVRAAISAACRLHASVRASKAQARKSSRHTLSAPIAPGGDCAVRITGAKRCVSVALIWIDERN